MASKNDVSSLPTTVLFTFNRDTISRDLGKVKRLMYIMIDSKYNMRYFSLCVKIASSSMAFGDTDGNASSPDMPSVMKHAASPLKINFLLMSAIVQ